MGSCISKRAPRYSVPSATLGAPAALELINIIAALSRDDGPALCRLISLLPDDDAAFGDDAKAVILSRLSQLSAIASHTLRNVTQSPGQCIARLCAIQRVVRIAAPDYSLLVGSLNLL